jgi:hypothetical protein
VSSWLRRYEAGDRVQVWTEMLGLGPEIRADARAWDEAVKVARLTMQRVRANVELLRDLLPEAGYVFAPDEGLPVFEPPPEDTSSQLDELEAEVGRLPLALRCWLEQVGQVNLVGAHPGWGYDYGDPLVVQAPVDYVLAEYAGWAADRGTKWDRGSFTVDLAPDDLHKANISGGPPYAMAVPNAAVDGVLLWEQHQTTFVNYLRICFRWGGFPGWDRGGLDGWAAPAGPPPPVLREFADSLLPI